MTYQKTAWQNGVAPSLSDDNLNHLETQYDEAMKDVQASYSPMSVQQQALMSEVWAGDKVQAAGAARANYEDGGSTVESWASLAAWTYTSGKVAVSGGKLYNGDTTGGSGHGAIRPVALGTGGRMVVKTTVTIPATGTDAGNHVIIGVSDDSTTPNASGTRTKGIDFAAADNTIRIWNLGYVSDATAAAIGSFVPGGTYYVTITVDPTTVSVTVTQAGLSYSMNGFMDRGGMAVNSVYVFNNDTRATSGKAVGTLGFIRALSSIMPRTNVEDIAPFWAHISDNGTHRLHIALPKNYDPRRPAPLVLAFHGAGTNATNYGYGNNINTAMMSTFTNAGFIVCSASLNANLRSWGSDAGLGVYEYAYRYLKSFFAISSVIFHANSMGGIESLLTLARGKVPCAAWVGTAPTGSLRANFDANYAADITTAYGLASDGSDYATKTAGHDPMLMPPTAFRGVPMLAIVPSDDTSVIPANNWYAMEPRIQSIARTYKRIDVTGGHQSAAIGDQAPAALAWVQQFVGDALV